MSSLREADGTVGSIHDAQLRGGNPGSLQPSFSKEQIRIWLDEIAKGYFKTTWWETFKAGEHDGLSARDMFRIVSAITSRAAQKQKEQDGLFAGGKRYKYHIAFLTRRAYNNHIKAVQEQSADKARSDYLKSKELALLIEAHEDKARKSETKAWQDCIQLEVDQARKDERAKVLKEIEQLTSKPEGSGAVKLYITFKDWEILKQAKKV